MSKEMVELWLAHESTTGSSYVVHNTDEPAEMALSVPILLPISTTEIIAESRDDANVKLIKVRIPEWLALDRGLV